MFPRNPAPKDFTELMGKFSRVADVHNFVKLQLVAGAKFALAWVRVHKPRLDIDAISQGFPAQQGRRGVRMAHHYDAAHEPGIRMIRRLLEADVEFFTEFHYTDPVKNPVGKHVTHVKYVKFDMLYHKILLQDLCLRSRIYLLFRETCFVSLMPFCG